MSRVLDTHREVTLLLEQKVTFSKVKYKQQSGRRSSKSTRNHFPVQKGLPFLNIFDIFDISNMFAP